MQHPQKQFSFLLAGIICAIILLGQACGEEQNQKSDPPPFTTHSTPPQRTINPEHVSQYQRKNSKKTFTGTIDGDIPIQLSLIIQDGIARGSLTFLNTDNSAQANGNLSEEGFLELKIKTEKEKKGLVKAWFLNSSQLSGTWTALPSGDEMGITLSEEGADRQSSMDIPKIPAGEIYPLRHDILCKTCACTLQFHFPQIRIGPEQDSIPLLAINLDLRQQMQLLNNQKCERISNWNHPVGISDYKVKLFDQERLSIQFYGMGIDENNDSLFVVRAINYSLLDGEQLELEDLFENKEEVLALANQKVSPGNPSLLSGTEGKDFDFYLNENGIVFFYPQSAGQKAGDVEIGLSWAELQGIE